MSCPFCPYMMDLNVNCTFSKRILSKKDLIKAASCCFGDWTKCEDYLAAEKSHPSPKLQVAFVQA